MEVGAVSRVSLARQQLSDAGTSAVYVAAQAGGHQVENCGRVVLHLRNKLEADVQVTIRTGYARGGLKLADREVTVPAGDAVFVGPLDPDVYNQPGLSYAHVDYSATEGVTVAALLLP